MKSVKGFILLEVMLALLIFCLVVVGLARALGDTSASMLSSNRNSQVRLALQTLLAENRTLPIQIGVQADPPDSTGINYQHEWVQLNLVNGNKAQLSNLYELIVRASWTQGGQQRTQEASIYIYQPQ